MKTNFKGNKGSFLNDNLGMKDISENHKELLGLDVPENYFENSKREILEKIKKESNTKKKRVFSIYKTKYMLPVAAAIALLVTISILKPSVLPSFKNVPLAVSDSIESIKNLDITFDNFDSYKDDISIASLFVEDDDLDSYVDNYMVEQLLLDESNSN